MGDLKVKKQHNTVELISSLRGLLLEQETLELRNVRPGFLQYFFSFPLAMILINIQDYIWVSDLRIYEFPSATVLFIAFTVSATGMLVFAAPKSIATISIISATLTMAGLIPWFVLSEGYPAFVCVAVIMAGVGGCLSSGSFSFVFVLNNTERFFGAAFMLLIVGLVELGAPFLLMNAMVRKSLVLILTAGLCTCMYLSRMQDYAKSGKAPPRTFGPSIWLALYIFFSYFAIRIMNFYIPVFQRQSATEVWGALTLLPVFICILLQAVFKSSIWIMCNVFFITSITSYALWHAQLPEVAYLFACMDEVGLFVSFYLIGTVTNKFCNFHMHKLLVFLCISMLGVLYVTSELLLRTSFAHIAPILISAVLFIFFLLFSPAFSRHLFFFDWSEEFRKMHMTCFAPGAKQEVKADQKRLPSLDNTNLSLREKQVVLLFLRGLTLRQIAPELGLTFSTVSTYSKTIYRKLGINSRAELFLLFGRQPDDVASNLIPKE